MRKPDDFEIELSGRLWQVRFVRRADLRKGYFGLCEYDKRLIRVRYDVCFKTMLDTLIHELRHAQHEVMFEAEDFIDRTSTEIAAGIIKSGIMDRANE